MMPGVLGLLLVVDIVILHTPAMARARIELAFISYPRGVERGFQSFHGFGRRGPVFDGKAEIHPRLDSRCKRVRTVGLGGGKLAAVKRGRSGHLVRFGGCRAHRHAAAHAIAHRADLSCDLLQSAQEPDESMGIALRSARSDEFAHLSHPCGRLLLAELERIGIHRQTRNPVERVREQHDEPLGGKPPGHIAEDRPQSADVRIHDDSRPLALLIGTEPFGIRDAV